MAVNDTQLADIVVKRAMALFEELETPMDVIIDRLLTYAAFAAVASHGSKATAKEFRRAADSSEAGAFENVCAQLKRKQH